MRGMPNAFRRRAAVKPRRVIDACVLIASLMRDIPGCAQYLAGLTVQHHGYITHALLGEVWYGTVNHVRDAFVRQRLYQYVDGLFAEQRLHMLPLVRVSPELVGSFRTLLPFLSEDDALHLAEARTHGFSDFVTTDEELTAPRNALRLSKLGIRIFDPTRIS